MAHVDRGADALQEEEEVLDAHPGWGKRTVSFTEYDTVFLFKVF